ncbi:hypothetical protein [Acetobacterium wieringae]|uniref:hypothetical protein n=1 Tax=Acetobacterium wieringae TaxID=52694 RepID=UPI002033A56A|nr:hypothetical protein [Acetobacterium wieringae]URN85154.1 hypothetical protein CHL1_000784 [Acetobacterium wieringae]
MAYVDYTYYTGTYGGKISDSDFTRLSLLASIYIDTITNNRIVETTEPVKMASCAVIDALKKQETPEVASESSGKESRSYVQSGKTQDQKLYAAAYPWLINTGLLYRGLT